MRINRVKVTSRLRPFSGIYSDFALDPSWMVQVMPNQAKPSRAIVSSYFEPRLFFVSHSRPRTAITTLSNKIFMPEEMDRNKWEFENFFFFREVISISPNLCFPMRKKKKALALSGFPAFENETATGKMRNYHLPEKKGKR